MSRTLQRRQRPAALQYLPPYGSSDNEESTFSKPTNGASRTRSQSPGRARSQSPGRITSSVGVATTRASSPGRSVTVTGVNRTESAQQTVFVTITTTTRRYEDEKDKTPSPTKTIFFSASPLIIRITISDASAKTTSIPSITTAGAGSAQTEQVSSSKLERNPALSKTARIGLAVLGEISAAALLLIIGIVVWRRRSKKSSMPQDSVKSEMREPKNPFLDPPLRPSRETRG